MQAFLLGAGHAGLIVTDQGGPAVPPVPAGLDQDAETGRGLLAAGDQRKMILDINPLDGPGQSFPAEDAEKAASRIRQRVIGLLAIPEYVSSFAENLEA